MRQSFFRIKAGSGEQVKDLESLYALYTQGYDGVSKKDGYYIANASGTDSVNKTRKDFDSVSDKMAIFSWISLDNPEMAKYVKDEKLKKIIGSNNNSYDLKPAYIGVIDFLHSESTDKAKYSDETRKMFRNEAINVYNWSRSLYGD